MTTRSVASRREEGVALISAIAFLFILVLLSSMVFAAARSAQQGSRQTRDVTTALAAADAGAEKIIFDLGVSGATTPWDTYLPGAGVTREDCLEPESAPAGCNPVTGNIGGAAFTGTVLDVPGASTQRLVTVTGEFPAGSGDRATVRVHVERSSPVAFDYAMFADDNIKIHHHGGSFVAPAVTTNAVHSNASVTLDASSRFRVEQFSAVGDLEMAKGVASVGNHSRLDAHTKALGGKFDQTGYSWRYNIGNGDLCYPGAYTPPASGGDSNNGCLTTEKFSGNATIIGDIFARSVTLTGRGNVPGSAAPVTTVTGVTIPAVNGDLYVDDGGSAKLNTTTVSGPAGTIDTVCGGQCGKGAAAAGGQIGGKVEITAEPPAAIEFPSIDYESTYKLRALGQQNNACLSGPCSLQDAGKQHVFNNVNTFFDYITNPTNGFYMDISDAGVHTRCTAVSGGCPGGGSGYAEYILLRGDWYVTGGVSWDMDAIHDRAVAKGMTSASRQTLPVVIAGSLISPQTGIDMKGRVYMVGLASKTDFLERTTTNNDGRVKVNVAKFLSNDKRDAGFPVLEPAVLAAAGKIGADDDDRDDPWESSSTLEIEKVNAIWVRGLVYSGVWNSGLQRSAAADQHWHNLDPKNSVRIYGSQVGGELHDCNNFEFTYDPIVKNAFGFGSGTTSGVQVMSWDEV